jgi:signal transduction histidine kinase
MRVVGLDVLLVRPLVALAVWTAAAFFPGREIAIRALAVGGCAVNLLLWWLLRRVPPARHLVPGIVNACVWAALVVVGGGAQSPFVLGFFLEMGIMALRQSAPAGATVTALGAVTLAVLAVVAPDPRGRTAAWVAALCVSGTGAAFVLVVHRLGAGARGVHTRAAHVAHGVKSSLCGVAGFADLLADDLPPEDPRARWVERMRAGIDEAHRRLGELMTVDQPPTPVAGARVSLRSAAETAIEACGGLLCKSRIEARNEVPAALEARIDPSALHAVLLELVQNAVEAMGPHGGTLSFTGTAAPLHLCVRDTGPGISEEIAGRDFAFGKSTRANGHGIGLNGAHDALRRHGGSMRASRLPGGGTEVRIDLPTA